ncbi:MAG: ornithine cyclodeaminase family protein, partial [Anaerolineae bacterium]
RTGAGSGLATELLAREDAEVVAVFGAGAQARTQLEAVRTVRPIREVRIVSRTRESAQQFVDEIEGVEARVLDDRSAAVRGAGIIIAATTSSTPVFDGRDVEPGTHINGIGSYTPEMQEVDATVVQRAKIVVDQREAALAEAGDLIIPIRQGLVRAADIYAELGEIVNGEKAGRTSDDEITFFKSVGNAAQDVATARWVLRAAEERGLGTVVAL